MVEIHFSQWILLWYKLILGEKHSDNYTKRISKTSKLEYYPVVLRLIREQKIKRKEP